MKGILIFCALVNRGFLSCVPDHILNIHGYKIFRCDNGRGVGVCIYVREDLSATEINEINLSVPKKAGV